MPSAVITGLGCISGAGNSVAETMNRMYSGIRSANPPSFFQTALSQTKPVFEVNSNDPQLKNPESRSMALCRIAAAQAMEQSELDVSHFRGIVGTAIGTTVGYLFPDHTFYSSFWKKEYPGAKGVHQFLQNNPAVRLAKDYECRGPAVTIGNACSSGTDAIGLAKLWIESGACEIVLAGGTDELCRTTYLGFNSLLVMSSQPCRPFDRSREGLNLGEGAGILVVESADSARKRGVRILAEVCGYGCNADAFHATAPHPEGLGLRRATAFALQSFGIGADDIAFVNAHGTSTIDNDLVEGKVLASIYGSQVPVVSTKSFTGHTLGAAGALEAIFTVQGLLDHKIPATVGFKEEDDRCQTIPTTSITEISGEYAVSNSLAFGGQNSVLVFRRYEPV
jgi:3-oxoacyl-(acyl-carrier-protein) synthase